MMDKMVKWVFGVLLVLSFSGMAQNITPMELKSARVAMYQWIRDYEVYATCKSKWDEDNFVALFSSDTLSVFNDYLPDRQYSFEKPRIKVNEYYDVVRSDTMMEMMFDITNVRIQKEQLRKEGLFFSVRFDKTVRFVEKRNYKKTRYEYPARSFCMDVDLLYDMRTQSIRAIRMVAANPPKPFVVLHDDTTNVYISSKELKKEETLSPCIHSRCICTAFDPKIYTRQNDTTKNWIGVGAVLGGSSFVPHWEAAYSISDIHTKGAFAYSLLLHYDRMLHLRNNGRWGMDVGLQYGNTRSSWRLNYADRMAAVDPDGDSYLRMMELQDFREYLTRTSVGLPIGLRYDHFFRLPENRFITLFGKAGVIPSVCLTQRSEIHALGRYRGYYEDLFQVTMDQNGIYDFGRYELSSESDEVLNNRFSVDAFAAMGLSWYLTDRVALEGAMYYQRNVYDPTKQNETVHLSSNKDDLNSATRAMNGFAANYMGFLIQMNVNF